MTPDRVLVLVESNTTGTGRLFCSRAAALGLRPLVLTRDPDRYPYLAADAIAVRVTDTADPQAVLDAITGLAGRVCGVTSSSEYFAAAAAASARVLGLPAPDPAAILRCRDKLGQRRALRAAGMRVPRFAGAGDPSAVARAALRIGFPVVLKPVAGSGSEGVRLCPDAEQVRRTAGDLLLGQTGLVLMEEYVSGPEYSVEIFDGRAVGISRTHLGPEPFFVETGHDFPATVPGGAGPAIVATALRAVSVLGLGWGAVHVELRLSPDGPRIIEVNPRLAGGLIPTLVELATGRDLIAGTIARAAGIPPPRSGLGRGSASIRFLVAVTSGRLVSCCGTDAACRSPGVVQAGFLRAAGERITLSGSFRDRLGYVIAAGPGSAASAETALGQLTTRSEPMS